MKPQPDDSSKVISLLEEAYASRTSDLHHSIKLAKKAHSISVTIPDKRLMGKSLNQLSLFYMIMGNYKRSISMAKEAIVYFTELGDEKGIADAGYNIAGTYYKTDNYHLGLIHLINSLTIYRKFDDHHNQARVHKSLGTIYEFIGDRKNAINSYESAIKSAKKIKDQDLESNAYNPLSGIYLKQKKLKKALALVEKAIRMKEQTGDLRGLAFSLYGRGKVFMAMELYAEAEVDFKKALDIHMQFGEKLGRGMVYHKISLLYVKMGEATKAKEYLAKALDLSKRYNIVIIKIKCKYLLYQIYKRENQTEKALEYLEEYLKQKEEVINTQTLQVIENYELITQMKSLEKEAQLQKEKADIIDKKDKAEQSARVKQEFLSTMSHEIRTPLNAVITITSLLKDRFIEEEKELLDSLQYASNNLLLIINDILDFTKLDTGKVQLENRPCHFIPLINRIMKTYESMAKEKGLNLHLQVDEEVAQAYELDETKLSQIMGNLVSNAIKYTDTGDVDVEILKRGSDEEGYDELLFQIIDTGIGIPESYFDEMFQSFSQPKAVTTRKQGGSGLGLAIVKKLVDLHHGTVQVESVLGKGSVFKFNIRLKRSEIPTQLGAKNRNLLQNKTVLLAEDNLVNAMVVRKLLSNWGITTEHVLNGIEAVKKSQLKPFDFILMDIHMPEMNGFDATAYIREHESPNVKSPIFALTADITAEHEEEYLAYFNGFLRKPIEIDKLYEALIKA
ncbi:ATP-binding region ATPase domain protein [Russula earlei]|uniref:ATP-binding region ATPase domain protein n=1 Tax=Russula earlei TaxID=71964 RepID=A0ACC0TSI1_9AGAM|nr:ATP-binding region ATPase domain protein [Russula earlei]